MNVGTDKGNANTCASRCMDGAGIVVDRGMSILGGTDRVGAIADRGMGT